MNNGSAGAFWWRRYTCETTVKIRQLKENIVVFYKQIIGIVLKKKDKHKSTHSLFYFDVQKKSVSKSLGVKAYQG